MLQVKNLTKKFTSTHQNITPLEKISFEIESGTFASIVGRSGSGKSTLLSLLGALDSPTEGKILIDKQNITKLKNKELTHYRLKDIGFIFQQYNLIPNLTALENVTLPLEFAKIPSKKRKQRAIELLANVQLTKEKYDRTVNKLSGGEQQRVAIARALANKPKLILADEPTGNLDEENATKIITLLKSLCELHKTTVIIVTHDTNIAKQTQQKFRLEKRTLIQEK